LILSRRFAGFWLDSGGQLTLNWKNGCGITKFGQGQRVRTVALGL